MTSLSYSQSAKNSVIKQQYNLFESCELDSGASEEGLNTESDSEDSLSVGFPVDQSLPIRDAKELWQIFYKEYSTIQREQLASAIGYKAVYARDAVGRRLNICGGYVDLTAKRLRDYLSHSDNDLLTRCGYVTICDLSRDTRLRVSMVPGIGPKKLQIIENALRDHGLRFVTYDELNAGTIFGGRGFTHNFEAVVRHQNASERRTKFKVIEGFHRPDAEPDF